jgi:hypothetical protein
MLEGTTDLILALVLLLLLLLLGGRGLLNRGVHCRLLVLLAKKMTLPVKYETKVMHE